jgi:hypothetical protein
MPVAVFLALQLALSTSVALPPAAAQEESTSKTNPGCPAGLTVVESFTSDGVAWVACEDLQRPGGAIALVSSAAPSQVEWFSKGYEVYGSAPSGSDDDYYLNLTKAAATADKTDILAINLLGSNYSGITWELVASAVPPIRKAGVRAVVGSRGSVADTTFSDAGEDAAGYGFPPGE